MRTVSLLDSPLAAGQARGVVAELLDECGVAGVEGADVAVLLTSEAVTNAFQHATPQAAGSREFRLTVALEQRGAAVRVAVRDPDPRSPIDCAAGLDDEHGRGVALIESLAAKHGVEMEAGGKTVWFVCALGTP